MAKRGRKSVYDTLIKPRFDEVLEWLRNGATDRQIYENLGIKKDAFYKYKREKSEFSEILQKGRQSLVVQLRGALVKKALGFQYSEIKKYTKIENGKSVQYIEETKKNALPDVAAINLCLKNYDPDNWANDPQQLRLKEKELELRREIAEKDEW